MSDAISTLEGVGAVTTRVFSSAGYTTVGDLYAFNADDRSLVAAADKIRVERGFDPSYTRAMVARCVSVIYRAKHLAASPFIPEHFVCPITLEWLTDPVVTPDGFTYSRIALAEWVNLNQTDPISHRPLAMHQVFTSHTLAIAVNYHRSHHMAFNIMC